MSKAAARCGLDNYGAVLRLICHVQIKLLSVLGRR